MAVVKCKEVPYDREVEQELYGTTTSQYKKTYVRRFYILTDDITDEQKDILTDAIVTAVIPDFLDDYKNFDGTIFDTDAVCVRRTCKQSDDNPYFWTVHCHYGNHFDMTTVPAEISIGFRKFTKPFDKAFWYFDTDLGIYVGSNTSRTINVTNSAGDPFDPPLEVEVSDAVMKIARYEAYNDTTEQNITDYQDSINEDDFRKFVALTARMSIGAERRLESGQYWYYVTYEIEHNWETWAKKPMNRGYRYLPGGIGPAVNVFDVKTMSRTANAVPLKDNGDKISVPSDISYEDYILNRILDWSPLGLLASF